MSGFTFWDGNSWEAAVAKTWNGSSWATPATKIWNGSSWITAGAGAATTVYDVTAAPYNADKTGAVAAQTAIQAAIDAAATNSANGAHSTVYFPPGTYRINGSVHLDPIRTSDWYGASSPAVVRSGQILLSGYGATIKYDTVTTRISWLMMKDWPTVQYTTYGNIDIEGFEIDNNDKSPTGSCGYIFWMTGYANYDNITFKDITTTDNIAPRTGMNTPSHHAGAILINGDNVSPSQTNWGYCTNITIDNCTIHAGGKSVSILSASYGTYVATKYLFDEINVIGGYFDNHGYSGSNIHLVSSGRGRSVSVVGADCRDSADDGIEINNSDSIIIEDCHFEENRQPICFTWFSYPYTLDAVPYSRISRCTVSGPSGRYYPNVETTSNTGLRMPTFEVRGYTTNTDTANAKDMTRGDLIIEDCDFQIGFSDDPVVTVRPLYLGTNTIPLESVTITDCTFRSDGALGTEHIYVKQGAQLGRTLPITINNVQYANSLTGALSPITSSMVLLSGSRTVTSDISGLS